MAYEKKTRQEYQLQLTEDWLFIYTHINSSTYHWDITHLKCDWKGRAYSLYCPRCKTFLDATYNEKINSFVKAIRIAEIDI